MSDFAYLPVFAEGSTAYGTTEFRPLDAEVSVRDYGPHRFLEVPGETLRSLSATSFRDIQHLFRPSHLQQLRAILDDPDASDNDRFVAREMLKNACTSAGMVLPSCQDTGTAIVHGTKGQFVLTDGSDAEALSRGVFDTYTSTNLRYSQLAPKGMFEEANTGSNLPAQIDIAAGTDDTYKFMFVAKGGGSANKTFLFQGTPALMRPGKLEAFLDEKIKTLGTAACPPYHLAVVIGGLSAEQNLKTLKLATCRYLDNLPGAGLDGGYAYRDRDFETVVHQMTRASGIGAQFGGKYFCHDVRVIRLPRHSASVPIGIGVSCSADRQALAKITADGVFLEKMETDPARFLPEVTEGELDNQAVRIDLNQPMSAIRATLSQYPIKTRLSLSGTLIVARDIAHARFAERLEKGQKLPDYVRNHMIYYAGPAKRPEGYASGSFGPTTAARMDSYLDLLMRNGGSYVTLAKGNRSPAVRTACKEHGGFYLGSIGGAAGILAERCIKKVETLDYPELGMEAVWKIDVEDFPAFIVIDDKGNDFFAAT